MDPEQQQTATEPQDEDLVLGEEDVYEVLDQSDDEDRMEVDEGEDAFDEMDEDEDIADESIAHFVEHQNHAIFCIATHPVDPTLVVSGGEDDTAYLWRADDGQLIAKLSGHQDSVTAVGFSFDGELVATGGMDGRVRLWRRVQGRAGVPSAAYATWEFLTNLEGPDEWLSWHPKGLVLAAGSNAGAVWLWSRPCRTAASLTTAVPSGKVMNVLSAHTSACAAGVWTPPDLGKRLLTASAEPDATVCLWDPRTDSGLPEHKWTLAASSGADKRFALAGGVNALASNSAGSLALVGGQADGDEHGTAGGGLRVINLASGTVVGALEGADGHSADASIEALAWVDLTPTSGVWLSAGTDGKVCAWAGQTGRLRWAKKHDDAVSALAVHPNAQSLSTSSADRSIRTWDVRTGNELTTRRGHRRVIHALAITKDGSHVASGGDDGLGRVFKL